MKQFYFLTLIGLIFSVQISFSSPISEDQAYIAALNKIEYLNKTNHSIHSIEVISIQNDSYFYVVNLKPQGFIIVSGDTELHPIYAYSFTNNFKYSENKEYNPLETLLKNNIRIHIENLSSYPDIVKEKISAEWNFYLSKDAAIKNNITFIQWPPDGTTSTGGWLETNWHQSAPYNQFCPMDPVSGDRSIAGCPSVALGMIIDYYMTLNGTSFTDDDDYYHNWGGRQYTIDDDYIEQDFLSFPEINSFFTSINTKYENNEIITDEEAAALIFACGVAATQVYSSGASGTFGVNQAFDAYLKFNFTDAELLDQSNSDVYTVLAENMINGKPAHLAITDPPPVTMGHNVVVDGWNTDNYFHLNFGWGGSYNNWYLIPEGIPYGLTELEGVIVNIANPPVNNETEIYHFSLEEQSSDAVFTTDNISIEVEYGTDLTNLTPTFQLSLGASAYINMEEIISGETSVDFSNTPTTILVEAENGTDTKEWTVYITTADPNTDTEILSFELDEQTSSAVIGSGTIDIEVEAETDLSSLIPTFTLSEGATAEVDGTEVISSTTEIDFSSGSKTFVVTAQDETTTEDWIVNVTTAVGINYLSNDYKLFPNPCKDVIHIQGENLFKIDVYDYMGKLTAKLQNPNDLIYLEIKNICPNCHFLILKLTDKKGNSFYEKIIIE